MKKIPYSIEAARTAFDITKPQPQLFVTPDFAFLSQVLEEFADSMALRKGGLSGIKKLINSSVHECSYYFTTYVLVIEHRRFDGLRNDIPILFLTRPFR